MKKLAVIAPTIAFAAACSGSAVSLQPGQWETTVQFSSIEVPGVPEAQLAPMRAMMGQPQSHSECMTPEQAANPAGNMLNPGGSGQNCQFTENTFSGGTIRVHGTCQQPGRGNAQMTLDGTYTATTMQARITSRVTPPPGTPGPQSVSMSGMLNGRRTGDCVAGR
jgi:Protein of unknown function (DUF3617)